MARSDSSVTDKTKKDPIIILDDVFSELDEGRKQKVYEILKEYEQVFISGCQNEKLDMSTYNVEEGKVKLVKEELK
jgi:recombinational DNA repair ATPase RecF